MIELLAPAGDLEKLKIAIIYGADAVFIGGEQFSLRKRASNFSLEDIKEACIFAHKYNKKVHVTTNIIPRNEDIEKFEEYILKLDEYKVDAVICSSVYAMKLIKEKTNMEVHASTQLSIANSKAVNYYEEIGVNRVVLAREVSINEIKMIRNKTKVQLEVFIHGGMCTSYSGRCILSNEMTDRDANRGGCAHSCRWNYDLYDKTKINKVDFFSLSSKDLCAVKYIPLLMDMKIDSLKIEGRMKSIHYIATIVNAYRNIIDDYSNFKDVDYDKYDLLIKRAENRLTSSGFFEGEPTINEQLYKNFGESPTQEFVGIVKDYKNGWAIVEQRNYFTSKDDLELFSPTKSSIIFMPENMTDEFNVSLDIARHPKQIIKIKTKIKMQKYDILRKVSNAKI